MNKPGTNKPLTGSLALVAMLLIGCGGANNSNSNTNNDSAGPPPGAQTPAPVVPPPVAAADRLAVPKYGDPRVGAWGQIIAWSDGTDEVLPIHGALLPDGRVLTFGTHINDGARDFMYDVWTPPTGSFDGVDSPSSHMTLPLSVATHIFCSAQILLPTTGELLINGGDNWNDENTNTSTGTNEVNIFSPDSNSVYATSPMNAPRWYATPTVMPGGEIYLQGGTDGSANTGDREPIQTTKAEIRGNNGVNTTLTGFDTVGLENNYPRNFVANDGKIFGFDHPQMYRIDPHANDGKGSRTDFTADNFATPAIGYRMGWGAISSAVMYRPGKILVTGGYFGALDNPLGLTSSLIDITDPDNPVVTAGPQMDQPRAWGNATVLPDGKVMINGGARENVLKFDAATYYFAEPYSFRVEIYDPQANTWTAGPSAQRMRLYHSISMLLPNGSVLTAGSGSPGPQLNMNAEIWYPHYLFNPDGSWATRPTIQSAPSVVNPSASFTLSSTSADTIEQVVIIKNSSVTHSFNFEQRFVPLTFERSGTDLNVTLPANPYETPPGFYMVFVLNADGVPSEAKIIRINPV